MRPHVDAPAKIRAWSGRRAEGSRRPRAAPTVPRDLSDGIDIYGSLVTREPTDWYVAFVPGLEKQWWHKFVNKTHKHVFAIRPLAAGNWLLVESWWTRLMIVVLPFSDAMKYLRWGDSGDILKVGELIPGKGNQMRGWSNCAVLATFVLGRRSHSWLPQGLYKELLKQGAEKQDLKTMMKVYCETSAKEVVARSPYLSGRPLVGPIRETLFLLGREILIVILSPEMLRLCKTAITESERFPEASKAFFQFGIVTAIERLSKLLESASGAGEVRIADCREAATLLIAMLRGNVHFEAALEMRPIPTVEEIDTRARDTAALFLDGLRGHAS